MAGLRGNQAYVAAGKQAAKGTVSTFAATNSFKSPFSGGNVEPSRNIANLSETDANRDQGVSYVSSLAIEGAPEIYGRDSNLHWLLEWALGAKADTGAGPNYTHTMTPANALPYITVFRSLGGDVLMEQFLDCQVSELTVSAEAGAPMTAAATIMGRSSTRQTSVPAAITSLALASDKVYNFNDATVTLAGGATALVSSFELTIANNVSTQQTDDVVVYDVVPGIREVTLGFTIIFETLDEYNRFHYGTTTGTVQTSTLATVAADFQFDNGANNQVKFTLPSIAYEEFGPAPDPGGDPITVDVRARAQRGGSPVVTAVVKNQSAT